MVSSGRLLRTLTVFRNKNKKGFFPTALLTPSTSNSSSFKIRIWVVIHRHYVASRGLRNIKKIFFLVAWYFQGFNVQWDIFFHTNLLSTRKFIQNLQKFLSINFLIVPGMKTDALSEDRRILFTRPWRRPLVIRITKVFISTIGFEDSLTYLDFTVSFGPFSVLRPPMKDTKYWKKRS